jgi:hypothetical protein
MPRIAAEGSTGSVKIPARDLEWDRPIFRAPILSNPHVIFDPLPFRNREPLPKGR